MAEQTKRSAVFDKTIGRLIPRYAFFSVIFCFVFNQFVYSSAQFVMKDAKHYDFTSALDNMIPYEPVWIWIYLSCFGYWIINYILITRLGKEEWFRFAAGDYLSRVCCGIFFFLLPTTNVRPEEYVTGLTGVLMRFMQNMDAPTNLFPSVHCLVSWLSYVGIRGRKEIPKWYRIFSCVFALMVFVSTQFTKQHYLIDIAGALVIAELCYWIGQHTVLYQPVMKLFEKVDSLVFGVKGVPENGAAGKAE